MTACEPPPLAPATVDSPAEGPFPMAYIRSPYGPPEHTAIELTIEAMRAVTYVPKDGKNAAQGFNFRGIDGCLNACGPALRKAGVLPVPYLAVLRREVVEVGARRTPMDFVYVEVVYAFYGPAADAIAVRVPGSAMDSGDKAITKAMSVAYRTALIQLFALPTQEPDPDDHAYERAPLLDGQAMAARDAVLAASTVEAVRAIYAEARAVAGLGAVQVPDADGHPVTLAALIQARGEALAAAAPATPSQEVPANSGSSTPAASDTQDLDPNTRLASNGQLQQIGILLGEAGVSTREHRLQAVSALVGRQLTSSAELTMVEARDVIKQVRGALDDGAADAWLAELVETVVAGGAAL